MYTTPPADQHAEHAAISTITVSVSHLSDRHSKQAGNPVRLIGRRKMLINRVFSRQNFTSACRCSA